MREKFVDVRIGLNREILARLVEECAGQLDTVSNATGWLISPQQDLIFCVRRLYRNSPEVPEYSAELFQYGRMTWASHPTSLIHDRIVCGPDGSGILREYYFDITSRFLGRLGLVDNPNVLQPQARQTFSEAIKVGRRVEHLQKIFPASELLTREQFSRYGNGYYRRRLRWLGVSARS